MENQKVEYTEVSPNIWKPEKEEDFIEGVLIAKKEKIGANDSNMYMIETSDKKQLGVWGSTVLDDRMNFINVGEFVRIEFKGTKQNVKGQPLKLFKVMKGIIKN